MKLWQKLLLGSSLCANLVFVVVLFCGKRTEELVVPADSNTAIEGYLSHGWRVKKTYDATISGKGVKWTYCVLERELWPRQKSYEWERDPIVRRATESD